MALAGEFYREMVETHGDNPQLHNWEALLDRGTQLKEKALRQKPPVFMFPKENFVRFAFETEVNEFLKPRGLHLTGATLNSFVMAYLDAKEQATKVLKRFAERNYKADENADRFGDTSA